MSLSARIFVLFGGVIAVLLAAEWWLVAGLRTELRQESTQAALEVGSSVLGAIGASTPALPLAPARAMPKSSAQLEVEVVPGTPGSTDEGLRANLRIAGQPDDRAAVRIPMQRLRPAIPAQPTDAASVPSVHRIAVPVERVDALGRAFQSRVLTGSLLVLVLGLAVAAWLAHRVTAPLRELASAAAAIGDGHFGTEAPRVGEPRLDATIDAFNRMSHRLAELDARARAAQAREHLTEIGEIARGIAHSLRNPLHVVGLTLAELAGSPADDLRERLATTGRAQIERIDRTLRSFLQMSAGAAGPPATIDAIAVAQDVALEAAQLGGAQVALAPSADRPLLRGNPAEVRTALHVLVVNAVEASPEGGAVAIRVESTDDAVRFVVEDDGPGLPAEVRAQLFQPHVTTKEQGAGFGLFLAERIASGRYRGGIELEDRAPRGTRAVLTLHSMAEATLG